MQQDGLGKEIWQNIPELPKRLWQIVRQPNIATRPLPLKAIVSPVVDLFVVTAGLGTLVAMVSEHAPGFLIIDSDDVVRWHLLTSMLVLNAAGATVILYALLIGPLLFKSKHWHVQLMSHCLRSYALINVLITFMLVISVDELIEVGGGAPQISQKAWIVLGMVMVLCCLVVWTLVVPVARYCRAHFGNKYAYVGGMVAVILALRMNPAIVTGYFDNIFDKESICHAMVGTRFSQELGSGEYSRDALVIRCLAGQEVGQGG